MLILANFYFGSKSELIANLSTTCEKLKNAGFLLIKFLINETKVHDYFHKSYQIYFLNLIQRIQESNHG